MRPSSSGGVLVRRKQAILNAGKVAQGMIYTPLSPVKRRVAAIDQPVDNAPMAIPKVPRARWDNFPDAVIVAEERAVRNHPAYAAAKTGDVAAAKRLAAAFVEERVLEKLNRLLAGREALFAPVHAFEDQGINRIPAAFAELLAERTGRDVASDIIQANVVSHTGATGWQRMARPPMFDGEVRAGGQYVLVDDFVGQGGTLANLRGFIETGGGDVVGAITLTGRGYSAKLALNPETLAQLRHKHGLDLEHWWEKTFGYGLDRLTESEARYLFRAEDSDAIRTRILAARS